jgi:hypothetical protein
MHAETAVFNRWFYVTGFIARVLSLGFAGVIIKAKRDIPYAYQGHELVSSCQFLLLKQGFLYWRLFYSCRNASMTLIRAIWRAGAIEANNPTSSPIAPAAKSPTGEKA